jgi:hypothetical protein
VGVAVGVAVTVGVEVAVGVVVGVTVTWGTAHITVATSEPVPVIATEPAAAGLAA